MTTNDWKKCADAFRSCARELESVLAGAQNIDQGEPR
jgi:hypothetical protein